MANYIGNTPANGEFKHLDSIASQFNGSSVTFALQFNSVSQSVGDATQLIVSLNGIIQEPLTAYTLGTGGSNITFASAPASGDTCFIVMLGGVGNTTTPSDNSVTAAKIAPGAVTSSKISIDGDISFPDDDKLILGTGSDLQIYHSSNYNFIKGTNTGTVIHDAYIGLANQANNQNLLNASEGGAVNAYFAGDLKLSTTNTGIDVTGTVTSDGLTVDGNVGIGITSPGDNLHILGSSGTPNVGIRVQSHDTANATATLSLYARDGSNVNQPVNIQNQAGRLNIDANMDVIGVGTNFKSASYNILNLQTDTDDNGSSDDGIFKITNGSAGTTKAEFRWDESEDLVHISYGDHGRHISINSAGNVGINTGSTAPTQPLDVAGTAKADQYLLDAVAKDISDTAVDVFIYDTRKDSDGGAWRKRTQHTSWYNETLNTSTRGSRKEFPAVAVIVTESNKVTIYDGDDPDMPMWMVFDGGNRTDMIYGLFDNSQQSTKMLNGLLVSVGNDSGGQGGTFPISFIADNGYFLSDASNSPYKYNGNIEQRNDGLNISVGDSGNYGVTVSRYVNDVAMTVLPNAPIDAATGLPVPTIAVATNGGVSVIKDDGTVVDYTGTSQGSDAPVDKISFIGTKRILFSHRYASEVVDLVSSDNSAAYYNQLSSFTGRITNSISHDDDIHVSALSSDDNIESIALNEEDAASKSVSGLSLANHYQVTSDPDRVSCFITTDYNTGWMNGDIKLATLSDTDDTNVTGSSKFTNDLYTNFTASGGGSFTVNGNGTVTVGNGDGVTDAILTSPSFDLVIGKRYIVDIQTSGASGTGIGFYLNGAGGPNGYQWDRQFEFVATQVQNTFFLYRYLGHNGSATLTNAVVREAEADRSVNGNGLQVFGTVTKSAVATGADLMAYSGFDAGTYLRQPYNSDLNPGTGAVTTMGWYKTANNNGSYRTIVYANTVRPSGGNIGSGHEGWQILLNPTNQIYYYVYGPTADAVVTHSPTTNDGNWHFFCAVTSANNNHRLYVDGVLAGTDTTTVGNLDNSLRVLELGAYGGTGNDDTAQAFPFSGGSLCNIRVSRTAPSAEQIKKIYEDEKVLFQENAKATLYGTSDAVTALAYDDDTELLHAGTSAGRSVFQGLRRIDNTTDAVGAAISASNGMVAED